jgi:hypothetical protein
LVEVEAGVLWQMRSKGRVMLVLHVGLQAATLRRRYAGRRRQSRDGLRVVVDRVRAARGECLLVVLLVVLVQLYGRSESLTLFL